MFTGILSNSTLTLTSASNGVQGNPGTFLDGLQLEEAAPEPGTCAMMGLGCALLAFAWRTRRTVAA